MIEPPLRTALMALTRRARGLTSAIDSAGRRAVHVTAITGRANREGLRARPARAQPERRVHEALAQSARPRNAGSTAAVAQSPTADASGRTVESANEGPERQLRVLTSSQSPSTIAEIPEGHGRCGKPRRRGFPQRPQPVVVFFFRKDDQKPREASVTAGCPDFRAFS